MARVDDRRVINGIFYVFTYRFSLARPADPTWAIHNCLQTIYPMGESWYLAAYLRSVGGIFPSALTIRAHHTTPPIGRSRGGLSTEINALADQGGLPLCIILSPGQASNKAAVEACSKDCLRPEP